MDPEEQSQDLSTDVEEHSTVDEQESEELPQHEGGYNPVFEPIRQALGVQFESIKPDLLKIEKGFNSGITNANSKYAPWKSFDEQGITPDQVNQGFTILQRLNDAPEEMYQALGQFLKENGRLPQTEAEVVQAVEDADDSDLLSEEQKQLKELQEKLDQQTQFFQAQFEQQEMQRLQAKADQDVASEYDAFERAHPELSPEDKQEIYQRHYQYAASGPQNIRSLEQVAQEYSGLVNRIRTAPRPNDSAPRLPGAGGGVPTGQRKQMSELSREESQDALVALLTQGKNQ